MTPIELEIFGLAVKPPNWRIYFFKFSELGVCVYKYQGEVLKLSVYQVHLWNLAKTASEIEFLILSWNLVCLWVQFQLIWKKDKVF